MAKFTIETVSDNRIRLFKFDVDGTISDIIEGSPRKVIENYLLPELKQSVPTGRFLTFVLRKRRK